MTEKIIIAISDHPEIGYKRVIVFEGIQYLFYSMGSAELVWLEYPANDEGQPIESEIIRPRKIVTPIDNANRVTGQGILITKEFVASQLPEGYTEEQLAEAHQLAFDSGLPEFDFWINLVNWKGLITQAGLMLEQFKRFDRK